MNFSDDQLDLLAELMRDEGSEIWQIKPITRGSKQERFPLSFAQQRLWFLDQLQHGSPAYNIVVAYRLTGTLNIAVLEQSLNEIVRRHEALRTTFKTEGGQPVQVVGVDHVVKLNTEDLELVPSAQREIEMLRLATEEAQQPFDLATGPLLRTRLLRLGEADHVLVLTMHHIVSDGWSLSILNRELAVLYSAYIQGQPSMLAELPIQYADYAVWQREWLQGEVLVSELTYWKQQLAGVPAVLELPTDRPRPAVRSFRGALHSFTLSKELSQALEALSRQEACSLFQTLLTAFQVLLSRYTGQHDIVVGSPIANRNRVETEPLIGFFANTLVLRTDLANNPSFREMLRRVRGVTLEAYAHQNLPFERLVDELRPQRDLSYSPLFQIMFAFQGASTSTMELEGLRVSALGVDSGTTKFDLSLEITNTSNGLSGSFQYSTDLFYEETIRRMIEHFQILLEGIVATPDCRIAYLPLVVHIESQEMLREAEISPIEQCLHRLFEIQAEKTPTKIAVVYGNQRLTYQELNERANRLAHFLQKRDIGPNVRVGLYLERSLWQVVAILGVLKAGGAYVPLDTSYPKERWAFMLRDAQTPLLLTQQTLAESLGTLPSIEVICLDRDKSFFSEEPLHNPLSTVSSMNLAYIIYTSGSTGLPKGVLVSHQNVLRLFTATQNQFHFSERDVWTLFHSYAFDFSVWEIWGALLYGGRLIVVPHEVLRTPEAFCDLLVTQQVTILNQTPSAFTQLMQEEAARTQSQELKLRLVIFGGEALDLRGLEPWFMRHGDRVPQLVNMYGITETTVHVTYSPITLRDVQEASGSIIGKAIPDLKLYVLDLYLQSVPVGVPGEIYVDGPGLAYGYLNQPGLTAERFIAHPFSQRPGARLYKTGDLARFLMDGRLEYLGRIDQQVKVRGFRIEIGEIENRLIQHPQVQKCVVQLREDEQEEKRLVAYVMAESDLTLDISELRHFLQVALPDYMVPATFMQLSQFPLTSNGKLDRKLLPAPDRARPKQGRAYVAPRTLPEEILVRIWGEVLNLDQIGIHDNFFELGGDSIRSVQIIAHAREAGLQFSVQQLFQHQTIAELMDVVSAGTGKFSLEIMPHTQPFELITEEDRQQIPAYIEDAYPLTMLQAGMLYHMELTRDLPGAPDYHNVDSYHFRAPFDLAAFREAIAQTLSRHAALRTSFDLRSYSEPLQLIHRAVMLEVNEDDIRAYQPDEQMHIIKQFVEREREERFDMSKPPLLRFHIYRRTDDSFQLTFAEFHPITDGWSIHSILAEIFTRQFALLGLKRFTEENPPATTFRDFVALERMTLRSETCQQFWADKLQDCQRLQLPKWMPPDLVQQSERNRKLSIALPLDVCRGALHLARQQNVPLKSVLLTVHLKVLGVLSGQSDLITGIVSHGRLEEVGGEKVAGLFLNTLPLRFELSSSSWEELLHQTFEAECELLPFRRYPLAEMQRRWGNGIPLLNTAFSYFDFHVFDELLQEGQLEDLGETITSTNSNYSLLAMFFAPPHGSEHITCVLTYETRVLCEEDARRVGAYYIECLRSMVCNPLQKHQWVNILSTQEIVTTLQEYNTTAATYLPTGYIHELFSLQALQTPEQIAVVFEQQELTYRELDQQTNQLAHYLRTCGVGPDTLVGIYAERSLAMVIGLLGVLKAGGAYVPLEPDYPTERLTWMIENAGVSIILTQEHLLPSFPKSSALHLCLDADWHLIAQQSSKAVASEITDDSLAYVIYTSGSTGKPKGAMNTHKGLRNRLLWMQETYHLTPQDRVLQKTPFSFDVSVWEFLWPLITGACMVVAQPEGHRDSTYLLQLITEQHISVMHFVPSMLQVFLLEPEVTRCRSLRLVVCSGEALSLEQQERFFSLLPGKLSNLYGPTEASIDVTWWICQREHQYTSVPLGHPIANMRIYVLDKYLLPVPEGAVGEIYLGGIGLARGYLHQPALTAQRFIPNPWSQDGGERLYATGDQGRFLPRGVLEYLGRLDFQVKIRGNRVELGEIETVLSKHSGVQEAVVLAQEDRPGDTRLVAYLVPDARSAFLTRQLMRLEQEKIPSHWQQCELPNNMVVFAYNKSEAEFVYQEIFEDRIYAQSGIKFPKGACILDVGANIGLFSLFVGSQCSDATIYAFEPVPALIEVLRTNVKLYDLNVQVCPYGLSDSEEVVDMIYYPHCSILSGRFTNEAEDQEVVKTFLLNRKQSDVEQVTAGDALNELLSDRLTGERFAGQLKTLSSVIDEYHIERIDILKIDVEKSELDVLHGIREEDWQKIQQVIIEVHDKDGRLEHVAELLKVHGYHPKVQENAMLKDTGLYTICAIRTESSVQETEGEEVEQMAEGCREIVWGKQSTFIQNVRNFAEARLPSYMLPAAFVLMENLPLTLNGKLDRRALPAPRQFGYEQRSNYIPPRNRIEHTLAKIWAEFLQVEQVGVYDDFFMLGGHSLLAISLMQRIQEALHVDLPLRTLLETPTIAGLSEHIYLGQRGSQQIHSPVVALQTRGTSRPLFLIHGGGGGVFYYNELLETLDKEQPVYGLQSVGFDDGRKPYTRIEDMAEHYIEGIRTYQEHGPYQLAGQSMGGVVAYEMSQQLRCQGEEVSLLVLLDSWLPSNHHASPDEITVLVEYLTDLAAAAKRPYELSEKEIRAHPPEEQIEYVLAQAQMINLLPANLDRTQFLRFFEVYKANVKAFNTYTPLPSSQYIKLLIAHGYLGANQHQHVHAWRELVGDCLMVFEVPGDHYTMLQKPHVQNLVQYLR